MLLSLVVPCFNEEGNVEKFFSETQRVFAAREENLEYVFVDDGSKDETLPRLKKLFDENTETKIQVLSFSRNFGKEAAMYAGLKNAEGDMVCVIDADLQQRPEVVIQMLDEMKADDKIDCVAAFQSERNEGRLLSGLKSLFYKLINKMTDVEFINGASDFRLMKRNMVDAVISMTEYHRFSKGIFSFVGFKTKYIPYTAAERESGVSKWSFIKLLKYALDGIIAFSTTPLKFASITGIISLIFAVVCVVLLFTPSEKVMLSLLLPAIFLIGAAILISLGIFGAYLSRAYIEVKKRPVYILRIHLRREENGKN